jgi:HK97 family phage major capsid protein
MPQTPLEQVHAALKTKTERTVELLDCFDNEKNPTDEQKATWSEELKGLEGEVKTLNVQREDLERRDRQRQGAAETLRYLGESANPMRHGVAGGNGASKTWGDRFIEDPVYGNWLKSIAPSGQIPDKFKFSSPGVMFEGSAKAIFTGLTTWSARSDTSGGALVPLDQRGLLDQGVWRRPLRIADLVTHGTTSGDTIEFVVVDSVTNAAAATAEATTINAASGVKPQSDAAFKVVQERVRTIAHWIAATRRSLADAGQLRTFIDGFLRYGLAEEVEDQIVGGNGAGENFDGVMHLSGTLTTAFNTDLLTTARKARTDLLLQGRVMPSAWVMHPSDWESFDLSTDNEARYYFGGPLGMGQATLWGIPVIESEAASVGTAILADWRYGILWDREQVTVMVSNEHADFFITNRVAILAEGRWAWGILRPKAFDKVSLA